MANPSSAEGDDRPRNMDGRLRKKPGPKPKKGHVPHSSRPALKPSDTAHVTLKLVRGTPPLSSAEAQEEIAEALGRVNEKEIIQILEYGIEGKRIHMTVKAASSRHLSKGMASLNTGLGMRLNRIWDRVGKGSVFDSRYALKIEEG